MESIQQIVSVRALVNLIKILNVKNFNWINKITGSVRVLVEPKKCTVTVTDSSININK